MTLPSLVRAAPEEQGEPLDYSTPPGWKEARFRSANARLRAEVATLRAEVRGYRAERTPDLMRPADLAVAWGLPLTTARRLWRARSHR